MAEWVNVSINNEPILKDEGSNPAASNLKLGLFQFSKWLLLAKNNNLGFQLRC